MEQAEYCAEGLTGGMDDTLIGAWELFLVLYKAMGNFDF